MVARLTVTADTNVYVSALHFGGKPRRLLEAARAGLFDLADPEDDRILECAVAAGARVVVSGDKHLLRLGAFEAVRIVTVAEFLDQVAAGPAGGAAG